MASEKERALQEELRLQQEIDALNARRARWQASNTEYGRRMLRNTQAELDNNIELLRIAQERTKEAENIDKKTVASLKSFARLSGDIKKNLGALNSQSNVYVNLQRQIIKEEEVRFNLSADQIEASEARAGFLRDISGDLLNQAKATAKAEQDARGINDFEQKRIELQENSLGLTEEQLALAKELVDQQEALFKKEQRLISIKESQKEIYEAIPESMQGAVGFGQKLVNTLKNAGPYALAFVLLAGALTAAASTFTKLEEAGEEFRKETGITNSQMKGMQSEVAQIVSDFRNLGVDAKAVYDTVAALKSEFSDIAEFSQETKAALAVLGANFAVSAENAAKVQSQLEAIGGLSSETAASVSMQVAQMSKLAGVAPAKVFADIAENAETTSKFFKGDINLLAKQAIEARRLGTNLKAVAENAEKLLDFETGIEEELVAATFVGGQFNLSRARALAYEGKLVDAQKETLAQIQRSGDFRKKDYFTQTQLAKAAGMSVEEINKQLNAQEKLNSLSSEQRKQAEEAISQGLDITNINKEQLAQKTQEFATQREIQSSLTNVKNNMDGLIASVGTTFLPLMQGLSAIFGFISQNMAGIVGFTGTLVTLFGIIYGIKMRTFILAKMQAFQEAKAASKSIIGAVASIFGGQGKLPIVGAVIAAAMVGALFAALGKAASYAGDLNSPAKGKTMISTKEGGLFELSPNDDIAAGPGISKALETKANETLNKPVSNIESSEGKSINLKIEIPNLENLTKEFSSLNKPAENTKAPIKVEQENTISEIPGLNNLTQTLADVNKPSETMAQQPTTNLETGANQTALSTLSAPLNAMINEIKALRTDLLNGKIAVYMDTAKVTANISKNVDQSTRNSYNLGSA